MNFSFLHRLLKHLASRTLYQLQEMTWVEFHSGEMSFQVYFYPDYTFRGDIRKVE